MVNGKPTLDPDQGGTWHPGELELQRRIRAVEKMADIGERVVRDYMPDQHREFLKQLPFIVVGSIDDDGNPWAGMRTGKPGFIRSPDSRRLQIDGTAMGEDPMEVGLRNNAALGLLGIELHTRRRNRMNGVVHRREDDRLEISVDQSFGNCPQYIQLRRLSHAIALPGPVETMPALDGDARAFIEAADTFFVASYADRPNGRQVDVSHRGGRKGFVAIDTDGILTIPDFAGNHFFATLGNILLNGRAGLMFVDFDDGTLLQMTGRAKVLPIDTQDETFDGAERFWRFWPERIVRRRRAMPLRFAFEEWSPHLLSTGTWQSDAVGRRDATPDAYWQPMRVTRVVDESATIRSLYLSSPGDGSLIRPKAGQHLPICIPIDDGEPPLMRTYTLSSGPTSDEYRISVKRDGCVSSKLHELTPGEIVEVKPPAGQFVIDATAPRFAVLLAGGIGITPLLAMLHYIVDEGQRTGRTRPTWLLQTARSQAERAFDAELADLAGRADGAVRLIRALSEPAGAVKGRDYDVAGRVNSSLLKRLVPLDDSDVYLCGPAAFMQSLYDSLCDLGVTDDRIHAEAFGPATIKRRSMSGTESSLLPVADDPVSVVFAATGTTARWMPGRETLLDLAEAEGLSPPFSCRGGSCGSCLARVQRGNVTYRSTPEFRHDVGEVLLCQALPATGTPTLTIEI